MRTVISGEAVIPALGLGTWRLSGDVCIQAVEQALASGYRHIDTAKLYGNEREVGHALRGSGIPREELFVTTKLWWEDLGSERIARAIDESLERLGSYADLLLIHWPHPDLPVEPMLEAMSAAVEKGQVKHLGVSNFPVALLERAVRVAPVVCNQVEYHPYLTQTPVWEACRQHGVAMTAYCPLAQGRVADDPVLMELAQEHDLTPGQLTLAWLLSHEGVVAIPKSTNAQRQRDNLRAASVTLSEEVQARVAARARGLRLCDPGFGPSWDAA